MDIEETLRQTACAVSRQAGELQAMEAALFGILRANESPAVSASVREHLERSYAKQLGGSTNPETTSGYEDRMALILLALSAPKAG